MLLKILLFILVFYLVLKFSFRYLIAPLAMRALAKKMEDLQRNFNEGYQDAEFQETHETNASSSNEKYTYTSKAKQQKRIHNQQDNDATDIDFEEV